jgi:acyl carrier protein
MATVLEKSLSAVFPAAEVEACIRDALADQAADQALLRPGRGTTTATPVAPRSWEPEIDSLVAVEVICAVEELLGIEIPPTFSPKGGYDSAEACINELMSEAKAAWDELTKEKETHEQ